MKKWFLHLIILAAVTLLTGGCFIDVYDDDYSYPRIQVSPRYIDFGYVYLGQQVLDDVWVDNTGPRYSRLYFSWFLRGDDDFYLPEGAREVILEGNAGEYRIPVVFDPLAPGDAVGEVVIWYSDQPLRYEINIREITVSLIGTGLRR